MNTSFIPGERERLSFRQGTANGDNGGTTPSFFGGEGIDGVQNPSEGSVSFTTRPVQEGDVEKLVDIDVRAFSSVYSEYDIPEGDLREDLKDKFMLRLSKIDHDWVRVAEANGEICGFIMTCPTSQSPEDFVSWEETTDNGTLENLYDPNGPNLYVVSLTMPRPVGGETPRNMLIADQIGKMMQGQFELAYFESRLPGLRDWVIQRCEDSDIEQDALKPDDLINLAEEYSKTRILIDGKQELIDPHLRMYEKIGCEFIKVVPDAYKDGPSLNFGMVAVYRNPLSERARRSKIISTMAGTVIRLAARSHRIVKKAF